MIVSLNYQNLYDFTQQWEFPLSFQEPLLTTTQQVESKQWGSFSALGLAYGLQISPAVSAGLILNFWDDWLGSGEWQHDITISGSGTYNGIPFESYYHRGDSYTINGFNVNLGVLWNITAKWNFGAVVKTPFEADLKHQTQEQAEAPPGLIPDVPIPEYQNLNMPLSYGFGLAYRFSDHLTGSASVQE